MTFEFPCVGSFYKVEEEGVCKPTTRKCVLKARRREKHHNMLREWPRCDIIRQSARSLHPLERILLTDGEWTFRSPSFHAGKRDN